MKTYRIIYVTGIDNRMFAANVKAADAITAKKRIQAAHQGYPVEFKACIEK